MMVRWIRIAVVVFGVFAAMSLDPPVLSAQTDEDAARAADLFDEAVGLFQEERYEEAAVLLQEAYALDPNPRLAFNVARALERSGQFVAALDFYRIAADSPDDPDLVDRSAEAIARVAQTLAEQQPEPEPDPEPEPERDPDVVTARLEVRAPAQPGATVRINGGPRETLPLVVDVAPGTYDIRVEALGFEPSVETRTLEAGDAAMITATLTRIMDDGGGNGLRTAGYATMGAGGAMIVMGAVFYAMTGSEFDDAERLGSEARDPDAFQASIDAGKRNRTLSTAFYAVGTAAVVGGGVMWVLGRDDPSDARSASRPRGAVRATPTRVSLEVQF